MKSLHLHPDVARTLEGVHDLVNGLEPSTWLHDPVLADVICKVSELCADALMGTHSDGRPLQGTQEYDERRSRPLVWDPNIVAWRAAYGFELTQTKDQSRIPEPLPKRLSA